MPQNNPSNVVLLGLENVLATQLGKVLSEQRHSVHTLPLQSHSRCLNQIGKLRADVVFCAAEPTCSYTALLQALKKKNPALPVIVVSRLPEVSEWLNALEAGAADYCCPPFESAHIRWILESALGAQNAA